MRNQEEAAASVGYLLKTLLAETQTYEKTAREFWRLRSVIRVDSRTVWAGTR